MSDDPDIVRMSMDDAAKLCADTAMRLGASAQTAWSLARSAVAAEAERQPNVGLSHFLDYLDAMKAGRIDARAVPEITMPVPAIIASDARQGAAHTGFDLAFDRLVATAKQLGVALFSQRNAFTCGALGYFTARLAEQGLAAFAATNGPALMSPAAGTKPVYCTNPLAFSAPSADGGHMTIDQASSATAFVNIRKAAEEGRPIPEGWAIDAEGKPTADPAAAVRGALLAFGGSRGANIALMVEVMAAGLSGANWSVDAPPFNSGDRGPATGLTVIAICTDLIEPDFTQRLASYLDRLANVYGVHIPGQSKIAASRQAATEGLAVSRALLARISRYA